MVNINTSNSTEFQLYACMFLWIVLSSLFIPPTSSHASWTRLITALEVVGCHFKWSTVLSIYPVFERYCFFLTYSTSCYSHWGTTRYISVGIVGIRWRYSNGLLWQYDTRRREHSYLAWVVKENLAGVHLNEVLPRILTPLQPSVLTSK